jgi:hypothetical protein
VKDAVSGTWTAEKGSLVASPSPRARLEIPWRPPQEYDLRVTFVRREGTDEVAVVIPWNGTSFLWTSPRGLENGTPHVATFRVRRDGLASILTGKQVNSLTTLAAPPPLPDPKWALRDPQVAGLGGTDAVVEFQSVQVLEVTGKGTRTRP